VVVGLELARRARRWWPLGAAVGGWLGVEVVARVVKAIVDRPRPPFADAVVLLANGSFPAAHVARATFALAVVGVALPARWRRPWAVLGVVVVAAVGWARLELGSHWLTDALGAWPFGLLGALPLAWAWRRAGTPHRSRGLGPA
jgi:undecaprenyl-diphosphatase